MTSGLEGVRGLVGKWREEATAYVVQANEKDKSGGFRWAGWMRDELRSKAGVCKRHADELESALTQQPDPKPEARGVVDDTMQIERHYAENIHYAALVLAQSKSLIDRREAVVLQGIVSRMLEARNVR